MGSTSSIKRAEYLISQRINSMPTIKILSISKYQSYVYSVLYQSIYSTSIIEILYLYFKISIVRLTIEIRSISKYQQYVNPSKYLVYQNINSTPTIEILSITQYIQYLIPKNNILVLAVLGGHLEFRKELRASARSEKCKNNEEFLFTRGLFACAYHTNGLWL